nr:MAG: capsid protein [Cressdnaviricota sp.]
MGDKNIRRVVQAIPKAVNAYKNVKQIVKTIRPTTKKQGKKVVKKESMGMGIGHSSIQDSSIVIRPNPKGLKLLKNESAHNYFRYQQTHKYILTSPVGLQSINQVCTVNSSSQIITSTGTGYSFYQNDIALEQLNPNLYNSGSAVYTAGQVPLNEKFIIRNNSINIELTNFSPVGAILDVYILKTKKSTGFDPLTLWNSAVNDDALPTSIDMQFATPGGSTSSPGRLIPSCVGVTPSMSRGFTDYLKIEAVKHVELIGASTQTLNIDIYMDKVVKTEVFRMVPQNIWMPNLTYSILIVQRGSIVSDNTVSVSPVATYGQTRVGCIVTSKTVCSSIKGGASSTINTQTGYSNISIGVSAANQGLLNEVDAVTNAGVSA